jgi:transposase InsO family protein
VVDLFSRKVVDWACAASMTTALVTQALQMAVGQRHPTPGLLHHSDRDSQYVSAEYQGQRRDPHMICSMSRKGNCYDNAVMERVFRSLKEEGCPAESPPETRAQAMLGVIDYLVMFYKSQRLHSTLGYQNPNAFEARAVEHDRGGTQVSTKERSAHGGPI